MSGITEILLIILIVLAIFFLPRLLVKKEERVEKGRNNGLLITWKMRIAILVSILWLSAIALLTKPWEEEILRFLYIGIAPVVLLWGVGWIIEGYRKGIK